MDYQGIPSSGARVGGRAVRAVRPRGMRRNARGNGLGQREKVRLAQLLVCLALFLAVFIGKGIFPEKLLKAKYELLSRITANTDFRAALSDLGTSLTEGGTVLDDLGEFCVEVFGGGEEPQELEPAPATAAALPARWELEGELVFLDSRPDQAAISAHYWRDGGPIPLQPVQPKSVSPQRAETAQASAQADAVPAGAVISVSDYSGDPLPEKYTMDLVSLGGLVTADPVVGRLTSGYGYRDHPISGKYHFHGGADISGSEGDPIGAFADGEVEYIGKDDSYGLYLQVDHGNGIKSFYAHCSKLCVSKGQVVKLGEKVAEIGATGTATGPHLHLEVKYNNLHLNPEYYVKFVSSQ